MLEDAAFSLFARPQILRQMTPRDLVFRRLRHIPNLPLHPPPLRQGLPAVVRLKTPFCQVKVSNEVQERNHG